MQVDTSRIVRTTNGFPDQDLRSVELPSLVDLVKVAGLRNLPVLHDRTEFHGPMGDGSLDRYAVIDAQQETVYRFSVHHDHTRGAQPKGQPKVEISQGSNQENWSARKHHK